MSLFPKQQLKFAESKKSALKGLTTHYTIKAPKNQTFDPKTFLSVVKQKALENFKPQTLVRLVLRARMERILPTAEAQPIIEVRNFQSKTEIILKATNLDELWIEMVEQILENISVFQMNGSGWTFHSIVSLDINTEKYKPLRGGSWVPTPKFLANKKALVNMKFQSEKKNKEDNQWSIVRALKLVKIHPERITKQLEEQAKTLNKTLNFDGIAFPVSWKGIDKFEKQNPKILVNVLGYEEKNIHPLRISEMTEREREVNLLLLENKHYVLINDLSRLLTSQMTNHTEKRFFCLRCLNSFTKKEVVDRHREYCGKHDLARITMPEKGSTPEFKNHKHSMRVPIVVYADFEYMTKPIQSCQPNSEHSYTEQYQTHKPSGFCFYIVYDGKNWNRFCIQNNLRMKTWLKYSVKDFGTILKKFGLLKLNQ